MSLPLSITPLARRDITELADYIARESLDAALEFVDAAQKTCLRLGEMPELGSLCGFQNPHAENIRVWAVADFPNHLIFYRRLEDRLDIVRVLHGARDYRDLFGE